MNDLRFYGMRTVTVTQSRADFGLNKSVDGSLERLDGSRLKHNHPFEDWQHRLKRGEKLPRGRFFRGKTSGSRTGKE